MPVIKRKGNFTIGVAVRYCFKKNHRLTQSGVKQINAIPGRFQLSQFEKQFD